MSAVENLMEDECDTEDDDDEDETDDDDDDEFSNSRTPTNEITSAADEFKWVRHNSSMMTCLVHEDSKNHHRRGMGSTRPPSATKFVGSAGTRSKTSLSAARMTADVVGADSDSSAGRSLRSIKDGFSGSNRKNRSNRGREVCPVSRCGEHHDHSVTRVKEGVRRPRSTSCCRCSPGPVPPPVRSRGHRQDSCGSCPREDLSPAADHCVHQLSGFQGHSLIGMDGGDSDSRVRARSLTRRRTARTHDDVGRPRSVCSGCFKYNPCRDLALEYLQWRGFFKANGLSLEYDDLQDKVQRLESDKENLTLQVSVLHEQIDAQTDKIRDLESMLDAKKGQLGNVEDMLQHGLMTLESQKLDLMSEISNLKLRFTSAEKDKLDIEERYRKTELEVIGLKTILTEKEREILMLKSQASGRFPPGIQSSPDVTKSSYHVSPENSLRKVQQRYLEVDKLRKALECVMAANDEKDRRIDELENAVARYKHVEERVLTSHFRKSNSVPTEEGDGNEEIPRAQSPVGLNSKSIINGNDYRVTEKPPSAPRGYSTSTPLPPKVESSARSQLTLGMVKSSPESQRATSFEEIASTTPPAHVRHCIDSYGTIPSKQRGGFADNNALGLSAKEMSYRSVNNPDLDPFRSNSSRQKSTGLSFGKGFFWLKTSKRSCSAPNLGPTESTAISDSSPSTPVPQSPQVLDTRQKPKGIKRIFGKLKRSNSQHLEDAPGEFRRGGFRATAGPRLAWTRDLKSEKDGLDLPFAQWNGEKIASWLHDMGLTAYIGDCKRWVKSGDQLLRATQHDLEKELGIKHPLHRKKLQLALQAIGSADVGEMDGTGALDHVWVTRWLDDVGLPQYKDTFLESRIDGRMLNFMTVEDLFMLKVTNMLHYVSLKRGIQVLRQNNFNPNCLKRRPGSDENGNPSASSDVVLWTNHRVMEWLRLVDLSEYAPNLRGSGVHGSLMMFEPRFNADLLATLLSIPTNKSLLRRHLSTHFKQLVGPDVMKQKREHEASLLYAPLTPFLKIKATRRSQFSLMKKRNKNDIEYEDYVCPHDLPANGNSKLHKSEKLSAKEDKSKGRPVTSHSSTSVVADKHL